MLDMMNKMAELKFEAPLAQFEESDEWTKMIDDESPLQQASTKHQGSGQSMYGSLQDVEQLDNMFSCSRAQEPVHKSSSPTSCTQCGANNNNVSVEVNTADTDNFGETFSLSLIHI